MDKGVTGSLELKTLEKVISRLEQASIPSMLTGSMALNFYGHPRATNDFDIVIEVQGDDEKRLLDLFRDDFYISEEAVRQAISGEGFFNIIDYESVFKIDLIVKKRDALSEEQFRRRRRKGFGGITASVISPEDLILAKLRWSRESLSEMQERDVAHLIRLLSKELDFTYMEKWAGTLGMLDRLRGFYVST